MLLPGRYFRILFTHICQRTTISRVEKRDGLTEILANMPWIAITCPLFFGFFKLFQLFCLFTQPRTHHQANKTLFRKGKSSPQALRFWASEISRKATFDIHSIFFPFLGLWWDITQHTIRGTSLDISDFSSLSCPGIAIWVMRLETFSEGLCFVWKSAYKWKIHIIDYSHVLWYKKRAFSLPEKQTDANQCKTRQSLCKDEMFWPAHPLPI